MGTKDSRHFQQDIMVFAQPNDQQCLRPLLFNASLLLVLCISMHLWMRENGEKDER